MKSDVAPNQRAQLEVQFHQGQKIEFYRAEPQDPEQPGKFGTVELYRTTRMLIQIQ